MFGQRLRLARRKAGLSMQELAGSMDPKVTVQAISKYETGKMMPSSAVLVGLGEALQVSLDFLMGGQVEALDNVEWRKHSGTSARERAMAEALVIEKLEDYLAIEDILDLEPPAALPDGLRFNRVPNEEAIEDMAFDLRKRWNLGIDPIPSMTALLEDKGIKCIELDLPERVHGMTCHVRRHHRPDVEAIVVSRHTTIERRRFSLAHELAHRIITGPRLSPRALEKAMDQFAGAFLMPRAHLREEAGESRHGVTWHEIMRLKRTYGVSAAAMLKRLGKAGILPEGAVDHAFRTWAREWRREEPEPISDGEGFAAFETPQRFERLVWRALGEKMISPVRAAQMLKRPLAAVERELRGPPER